MKLPVLYALIAAGAVTAAAGGILIYQEVTNNAEKRFSISAGAFPRV